MGELIKKYGIPAAAAAVGVLVGYFTSNHKTEPVVIVEKKKKKKKKNKEQE